MIFDGRAKVGVVLHGTVDESDTLVLKFLAVANFSGVRATTMSIIGWWRRGRSVVKSVYALVKAMADVPFSLRRDKVIQPQLTIDLFQAKVDGIVVKLGLRYAGGGDSGG